jgi:chaperonin cofactor prefoldin
MYIYNFIFKNIFSKAEKASIRLRNMKRREEELEEEVTQMKQRLRKALREKDEIEENPSYQRTR